jgi:hypothetical protein
MANADYAFDGTKYASDTSKDVQLQYLDYLKTRDTWQAILGGLLGTFALVNQYNLLNRQMAVAEEMLEVNKRYLTIAENAFNNIAVPTWDRQKTEFDRYVSDFTSYHYEYMGDAFRLKEYQPEYALQEGRNIASVQANFDRAYLQRRRQMGRYNTGLSCSEGTRFSIMAALARTDATNHGYRYEEAKKMMLDDWYWRRRVSGADHVAGMAARVTSGINGGVAGVNSGIGAMQGTLGQVNQAYGAVGASLGNMANFWGQAASMGFGMAGYAQGRGSVSPFGQGNSAGGGGMGGFNDLGSSRAGGNNELMGSNAGGGINTPGALPGGMYSGSYGGPNQPNTPYNLGTGSYGSAGSGTDSLSNGAGGPN